MAIGTTKPTDPHSVAITGLSCRFPGDADNVDKFWEFICNGRSAYSEATERFDFDSFHSPLKKLNTSLPRGGHFLKQDVAAFDANFFNISKAEAESIDPQQRIMMEVVFEALENAGMPIQRVAGTQTGVFMGSFTSDYREMLFRDSESAPMYTATGSGNASTSNRISWFYDFKGPSFTLNTACSSSLVAIHLACQSLRTGESDIAIVGGTSLLLNPEMFMYLSNQQFLAKDGCCKSFDESGDGYGRGDGVAAVILKRVDDAVVDSDPIRAVIRGTSCNQDGKTKGFTLPSADAQVDLIRDTYRTAGLGVENTHYVEAHGTGTRAGDGQETEALSKTFGRTHSPSDKLIIGSVKANIGHLEACAGLAALIKGVYVLENGLIPPAVHYKRGNPQIPFEEWNLKVPTKLTPWPVDGLRRMSTSAFGYGGTNAHAILDDAYHYLKERRVRGIQYTKVPNLLAPENGHNITSQPNGTRTGSGRRSITILTAADKDGLKRQRLTLSAFLKEKLSKFAVTNQDNEEYHRNLAYTLCNRRSRLQWTTYVVASSLEELSQRLPDENSEALVSRSARQPRVGFLFTGQGAQWARMGAELMEYGSFQESVRAADSFIRSELGVKWSAEKELLRDESSSRLHLAEYSQTLCTILQVALVELLESWNITPSAVAGHSSGEISAAFCLGALSREDAWTIAYYRGLLSSQLKMFNPTLDGAMMAVGASSEDAEMWISKVTKGDLVVACVNSPSSVTISGDAEGIEELSAVLKSEGVFARKLKVDTAYHSPHMNVIASSYLEYIAQILPASPDNGRVMHSSVSPGVVESSELGPSNWVRNLVSPVQFTDAVFDMIRPMQDNLKPASENAVDILVEVGPHSALQGPTNQTLKARGVTGVGYHSVLSRGRNSVDSALACAGDLFTQGVPVDIPKINSVTTESKKTMPRPLADLPTYPWNHSLKFWSESRIGKEYRLRRQPRRSLLGAPYPALGEKEQIWRGFIKLSEDPWLRDHKIQGTILFPGAGFLAMAIEAAREVADDNRTICNFRLKDVQIRSAAVLTDNSDVECIVQLRPHLIATRDDSSAWWEFTVSTSVEGQELRQNCFGLLTTEYLVSDDSDMASERSLEDQSIRHGYFEADTLCNNVVDPEKFYDDLSRLGLTYGPTFANLTEIRHTDGQSVCSINIPQETLTQDTTNDRPHVVHPGTMDSMFHLAFAAIEDQESQRTMVPKSIDEVFVSANIPWTAGTTLKGYSTAAKHGFQELLADVDMLNDQLLFPVVSIKGFRCADVSGMAAGTDNNDGDVNPKAICSKLTWKPAVELLSSDEQRTWIESTTAMSSLQEEEFRNKLTGIETSAYKHIEQVLQRLSIHDIPESLHGLYNWLLRQKDAVDSCQHIPHELINHTSSFRDPEIDDPSRALFNNLRDIMLGEVDIESLSNDDDLLNGFYSQTPGIGEITNKLNEYLNLLVHTKPDLSVLEVGLSSFGGRFDPLLPNMRNFKDVFCTANYTISGIDEDALDSARSKLESFKGNVEYEIFDIEQDVNRQPVATKTFDVIVAFNAGLSTQDAEIAIQNMKRLLTNGGKICLIEITNPGLRLLTFANFLDKSRLRDTGDFNTWSSTFTSCGMPVQMQIADCLDTRYQQVSMIVCGTQSTPSKEVSANQVVLVEAVKQSVCARDHADNLASELESRSCQVNRFTWQSDVASLRGKSCIVLVEIDSPFLLELSEEDFYSIKELLLQAGNVFWISRSDDPSGSLGTGLARSLRNEAPSMQIRTLQIDTKSLGSPKQTSSLAAAIYQSPTIDNEFRITDGRTTVSRIETDTRLNEEIGQLLPQATKEVDSVPLGRAPGPQKLAVKNPGMLDSMFFESDDLAGTDLREDEVEVDVKASGINFRDVMVAMGQIPDSLLGFEAGGVVRRVGRSVSKFNVGDRVSLFGHGAHRTIHRSKADFCEHISDDITYAEAATLPLVHGTAYYGLVKIAQVKPGQRILIHAAAGGVGQATIQLAQHFRMEIFATVGSLQKRELIRNVYGIPDDHIFNSRDLSFAKGVKRMTNGRGVDVVLNSLSGEALKQTWYCLAPFGTFLEIGMKDIMNNSRLDMRPFSQDAVFAFFNLNHIENDNPSLMAEIIQGTFDYLRRGVTRPIAPLATYPISEVENAFRLMQMGKHLGKIALTYSENDVVPVARSATSALKLPADATYLLVGGLGGIGRSVAKLLVDHGARNLCFISRSGAQSEEAQELIRSLEEGGVRVKVYCRNIVERTAVADAITECSHELPPIRGVVQCAMLLRDGLFENMSYNNWTESTRPKVQGSWNLHESLPDTDFFIVLSSFAGVFGSRGQSNYAAAGAYEDSLSHFRRSKGQKAVTLDLGIMRDIGVLAEKGITDYLREWEEPFGIRKHEFHALMKQIIADQISGSNRMPAQILSGFATGGGVEKAGISRPFYFDDPRFSTIARTGMDGQRLASGSGGGEKVVAVEEKVANAESLDEAAGFVADALIARVASSLQTSSSEIDSNRPLHSYGVDSLVAVEISNWAFKNVKATVTVFDILSAIPISALAKSIALKSSVLPTEFRG